jgi:uncharacterized pyridoxamine 5'-phosphate oxidase family protein
MSKVRHVLGISGGKDSAALAIYVKTKYPSIDLEFYTCDTGKELDETYQLIKNLEVYLGIKIELLQGAEKSSEDPFDHFLKMYGGYLPSSNARWCTKKLKLDPFEKYVGDDPVISYVGIRGDEEREGYISTKKNIQSIFPFRKNIWSEDVTNLVLKNENIPILKEIYENQFRKQIKDKFLVTLPQSTTLNFTKKQKLDLLLNTGTKEFNKIVFEFLKTTDYPLSKMEDFPLLENDEVLVRDDIFKILKESGVGVPAYYNKIEFEINGKKRTVCQKPFWLLLLFFSTKN